MTPIERTKGRVTPVRSDQGRTKSPSRARGTVSGAGTSSTPGVKPAGTKAGTKPARPSLNLGGLDPHVSGLARMTGVGKREQFDLDLVRVVPGFNPRTRHDPTAMDAERLAPLVASIRVHGVLQPVLLRVNGEHFDLVAGERRVTAARLAGLTRVPAVTVNVTDEQAQQLAIIENAQREDLSLAAETSVGFALMERRTGMTTAQLVTHLAQLRKGAPDEHGLNDLLTETFGSGVSAWSQDRAKLFALTNEERAAVFDGALSLSVAAQLTRLPVGEERSALFARATEKEAELSRRELSELVNAALARLKPGHASAGPAEGEDFASQFRALGLPRQTVRRLDALTVKQRQRAEALIAELTALLASVSSAGPAKSRSKGQTTD